MKILFCHRPDGAFGFITDGMINSLIDAGHTVARWNGSDISSWNKFGPDLYVGCSGHQQPIPNVLHRGSCKVAIHVNPHGPVRIQPNINESSSNITWVMNQKPDAVFGYGYEWDRKLWSYWEDKVQWVPMPTAGDVTIFQPKFESYSNRDLDFVYIGGRWDYKATVIDKFLLPVLKSGLKHEVWGWGKWPNGTCRGRISDNDKPKLYMRAKCAPCISEPHTLVHGIDLPERVFKAILSGCVAVHDSSPNIHKYIPSIITASSPSLYLNAIKSIAKMEEEQRKEIAIKQYDEVFGNHTYHHRMFSLFNAVGFQNEAIDLLLSLAKHGRTNQFSYNSG